MDPKALLKEFEESQKTTVPGEGDQQKPDDLKAGDASNDDIARLLKSSNVNVDAVSRGLQDVTTRLDGMSDKLNKTYQMAGVAHTIANQYLTGGPDVVNKSAASKWEKTATGYECTLDWSAHPRFIKSYDARENIAGSRESNLQVYFAPSEGDPLGMLVNRQPSAGSTVKLPTISGLKFVREQAQPANPVWNGSLTSDDVTTQSHILRGRFTEPAAQDVEGLLAAIQAHVISEAMEVLSARIFAVIKAAAAAQSNLVKTGVAAKLPTAANIVGKLQEMRKAVATKYTRAMMGETVWAISTDLATRIREATTASEYFVRNSDDMATLYGYRVIETDLFDEGDADNEVSGLFGNLYHGIAQGVIQEQSLSINSVTEPGTWSVFSSLREATTIQNDDAFTPLVTKA
ncbi:MAG: hypothetical protein OXG25_01115 [Gammaproteobacteria bacterium]|nr:hypothetical protein [Gammaproteobacteria bacterium]